jgi:hypothetical protein
MLSGKTYLFLTKIPQKTCSAENAAPGRNLGVKAEIMFYA